MKNSKTITVIGSVVLVCAIISGLTIFGAQSVLAAGKEAVPIDGGSCLLAYMSYPAVITTCASPKGSILSV